MKFRVLITASLLAAMPGFPASLRTDDATLKVSWERSLDVVSGDEVRAPAGSGSTYLSTVHLERGAGATYGSGSLQLLRDTVVLNRPAGPDDASPIRPDWPILLEYVAQWNPDSDETWDLVHRDLEVWLNHYLDRFSAIGLLKSPTTVYIPLEWSSYVPESAPEAIQRFLDSVLLHQALEAAARARAAAELSTARYTSAAEALRHGFRTHLWNEEAQLFAAAPGGGTYSPWLNAVAMRAGLWPGDDAAALVELIKKEGARCPGEFVPSAIEASVLAGDPQLAYDLLSFVTDFQEQPAIRLIVEAFGGLRVARGFQHITVSPRTPRRIPFFRWTVHIPNGRISLEWDRDVGYDVTVPPHVSVQMNSRQGVPITMQQRLSHAIGFLSPEQIAFLEQTGWAERTKGQMAVWVSVDEQMLRLIDKGEVVFQARCATAEKGSGFLMDSLQTPLGWHTVAKKIGDNARWGQVFRSRIPTREVWQPGEDVTEDLVLTRILWLTGSERGKNKGGNVDSYNRSIYIHGTNDETRIGTPSSHGCIRLTNDDVIEAFSLIPETTPILITDGERF